MADERIRVTLTKAHAETPTGRELIALLTELSADGNVTREEMERLRAWLEIDRGVDFPALGFLYEVVEQISQDGVITEEELDRLALAIERVLPKEIRAEASLKRKQARDERRRAGALQQAEVRAARIAERERAKVLHRARFVVRGALRSAERREACERLAEGDDVTLDREPDNPRDPNAILVISDDDCELGYVPREDAAVMAPLIDAGASVEATVQKLWETPDDGQIVPIVVAKLRRAGYVSTAIEGTRPDRPPGAAATPTASASPASKALRAGCGCVLVLCIGIVLVVLLITAASGNR
jgi:hypothetical protein